MSSGNDRTSGNVGRQSRQFSEPDIGIYPNSSIPQSILRDLMARGITAPTVEVLVQYPAPANTLLMIQSLLLDGITSFTLTRNEDPTADTLDLAISNGDGRYTPAL